MWFWRSRKSNGRVPCHFCMAHYLFATFLAPVKKRLSCSSNSASPPLVHTLKTATTLLKVRHSIPHTLTYPITSLSCLVQEGKPPEPHLQCNWQTFETRTRPQSKHPIPTLQNAGFFSSSNTTSPNAIFGSRLGERLPGHSLGISPFKSKLPTITTELATLVEILHFSLVEEN